MKVQVIIEADDLESYGLDPESISPDQKKEMEKSFERYVTTDAFDVFMDMYGY